MVDQTEDAPRTAAIRKFRELADRLESGELHGARVQWRHGLDTIEFVELDDREVRFRALTATDMPAPRILDHAPVSELIAYIDTLCGEIERLKQK